MASSVPKASSATAKGISLTSAPRGLPMTPTTRSSSSQMEKAWSTYAMPGANTNPRWVRRFWTFVVRFGGVGGGWGDECGEVGKTRTRHTSKHGEGGRHITFFKKRSVSSLECVALCYAIPLLPRIGSLVLLEPPRAFLTNRGSLNYLQ